MVPDTRQRLEAILRERIAVLDGSWGVLIQRELRGEEAYRGERFRDHPHDVAGDPDLLNITRPEVVDADPRRLLRGGRRHRDDEHVHGDDDRPGRLRVRRRRRARDEPRGRAARAARRRRLDGTHAGQAALRRRRRRPAERHALALAAVDDPAYRAVTFDAVRDAYAHQIRALREGGVDLLLIETVFDSLNAKAAIVAALDEAPDCRSGSRSPRSTRAAATSPGQTVEAFWLSVEHAKPLIVGVNCSLGAAEMRPFVEDMAGIATTWVACYPNAGLPNEFGLHDEQPHDTSRLLGEFARDGLVNVVGGCCGTTPDHVRAIAAAVDGRAAARRCRSRARVTRFSGLEPFAITPDTNFVMIGERTNVTGSARFRRLIEGGECQEALEVALEQVRGGANLLDVNMDADLLDGAAGDDDVPQPRRDRAGGRAAADHGRQLALDRARGGAQVPPGQGRRQLALAEGRGGAVPRAGADRAPLRRGRRRDGLRRAGAGRHRRSARSRSASARTGCSSTRSASRPRTSSSTRTCSPSRPASRSTTSSRRRSSRRCR